MSKSIKNQVLFGLWVPFLICACMLLAGAGIFSFLAAFLASRFSLKKFSSGKKSRLPAPSDFEIGVAVAGMGFFIFAGFAVANRFHLFADHQPIGQSMGGLIGLCVGFLFFVSLHIVIRGEELESGAAK